MSLRGGLALLVCASSIFSATTLGWAACPSLPPDAAVALVLSGGGAKAAWEAGVAATFFEHRVAVKIVAGSSAGALNAAMLADGRSDQLGAVWRSITRDQVYSVRPSTFFAGLLPGWLTMVTLSSGTSLLDSRPLRDLVASSLDIDRVRRSALRVLVVATDVRARARRVFDNATLTVDVLMAAIAVPGVFPPVAVDGELLMDGGLTGRAPLLEALEAGPRVTHAIVLGTSAPDEPGSAPTSIRTALEEAFETAMLHQIRRDVELARLRHPEVDVSMLTPSAPLDMRPLDFDADRTSPAFERGRADGLTCLGVSR